REPTPLNIRAKAPSSRAVYAAVHVVADPRFACAAGAPNQIDWEATLELRREIWSLGLGVAESMDTAQRGMGLNWPAARELAQRALSEACAAGGRVVVGVGTDQLAGDASLTQISDAYIEQISIIEESGGEVVVMASRQLARRAERPADYMRVYRKVLSAAQ